jgi:Zn-dependent protease
MPTRPGFKIAVLRGIPIYLHPTWLVIFGLITWSLANQYVLKHPAWTTAQHWTAGILTSVLFFASVIFHEMAHSVVAQHYKIRVVSITLFVFGGLASIERDPSSAWQEFNIAIAGPVSSAFLGGVFLALRYVYPVETMPGAMAFWLGGTNLILAAFNMIPGFPLDGGRIFRAIVWGLTKDFEQATRVAGASGRLFAYGFILYGGWKAFHGDWTSGLWIAFIGWFLLNAAQESVAVVAAREHLRGLRAMDVMSQEIPTFAGQHTLADYSAEVLRTGRRCHLVTSGDRLVGMMNVHALNSVPREEWTDHSVQSVMIPRDKILWAHPDEPLVGLLERLLSADVNQMPVISDGDDGSAQIIGMVTRDSILRVLQTRSELGPTPTTN